MIKKTIRKLGTLISALQKSYGTKDEAELLALGALLSKQQYSMNSSNINDYEFKIFSQFGDDGIIQYLIKNIAIENEIFIEFGVENYSESNTRFLLINNNWTGFIMDGSEDAMEALKDQPWYWRQSLSQKAVFIDKENINPLLAGTGFSNIGILSIDLDGNDYHILKEIDLSKLNPAILILEYNSVFGKERAISVPYDKSFHRTRAHYSNLFWGASLAALNLAANAKGYALIGCNNAGNNAYFIKKNLLNGTIKEMGVGQAFKESKFRESRSVNGSLTYLTGEERIKMIKGLDVFNALTNGIEKL
jgi:hypothetical protein